MLHIDKPVQALTMLTLAIGALWAAPTATSAADQDLSVTIYADDLALVQDHRTIDLTGGKQRVEFQNVSAQIRAETVSLAAKDALTIVEQNFDFDLLTPAKLMEKAVGHEVTIVRTSPGTGAETREKALAEGEADRKALDATLNAKIASAEKLIRRVGPRCHLSISQPYTSGFIQRSIGL